MTILFTKRGRTAGLALAAVVVAASVANPKLIHAQASTSLESVLSQAIELETRGNYAEAEGMYRQALQKSPDDPEILKRLGQVCQGQGKHEEATEIFERILKRAPLYPGVNALLGISYYSLNKFDKTIEADQKELTGNPKDRQARYYLSLALSASGRLFEAIQQLETLRVDDPHNPALLYQLVVDYKAAAQQIGQRLTREHPDSAFTHAIRAEVLADGERLDDAAQEFQEVAGKSPDFPGIHLALGEVYWRQKNLDKAQQELKLALQKDPNQPLANYYLGDILVTNQQYSEAIPNLELAITVYPELTRAYWLLGKCYTSGKDYQRARQAFEKALEQNPNYKEVHFQLHELYAKMGNNEESKRHLESFERLNREDQNKDREQLQEAVRKQKDSGPSQ